MTDLTISGKNEQPFLSELREKTWGAHAQLEKNHFSLAILAPSVTLGDFQLYLAKLYGIIMACETTVFPVLNSLCPDLDQRKRAWLIGRDLENTGIPRSVIENLPVYNFKLLTVPEALGVMYVLEGSTLGGKILYSHIHAVLGLNAEHGASYFWGYGNKTGMLWKTFLSLLTTYAVKENCGVEIISSANETFSVTEHWLNQATINWQNGNYRN